MQTARIPQMFRQAMGFLCVLLLVSTGALLAQEPATASPEEQLLSPEQLDDLVAPIALYPDNLLSQVLVASTYPLEVVEAYQWLQHNTNLQGTQLVDAASQQNWDASVQGLVVFPDVLTRLNSNVHWTTDLGNAFLAQQADVMSAVQRMRARAQANGKLYSTSQETVTTESQSGQTAIDITPTDPQVVYVPVYDPAYVWGPPLWGYYPALYYPAMGFGYFGPGIYIGTFFGGLGWGGWGWGPNWFGGAIVQNAAFFNHYHLAGLPGGGVWQHNPDHRQGIPYPSRAVYARFGNPAPQRGPVVAASRVPNSGESGGWSRFGQPGASGTVAAPRSSYTTQATNRAESGFSHFGSANTQASVRPAPVYNGGSGFRPSPSFHAAPSPSFSGGGRTGGFSGGSSHGGGGRR